MKKLVVAVLFGGISNEHEVSRVSATSVLQNLDKDRYTPVPVGITKEGLWFHFTGNIDQIPDGAWEKDPTCLTPCILSTHPGHHGLFLLKETGGEPLPVDIVFPVLHGKGGEDGTLQGLLELAHLPYVGCGVAASANCMDKDTTKTILAAGGVPVARWICISAQSFGGIDQLDKQIRKEFGYPVFVKPSSSGSSVGISKAKNKEDLRPAIYEAFREDSKVIIEETLVGREVECAVLGNTNLQASPLGEVAPKSDFYDYQSKYLDNSTDLYIPARLPEAQAEQVRQIALKAYRLLGCRGLSRVDFFANPDTQAIVLNEINTLPGFTSISMYPKLFLASGMTYPQLLDRLIQLGLDCSGTRIEVLKEG